MSGAVHIHRTCYTDQKLWMRVSCRRRRSGCGGPVRESVLSSMHVVSCMYFKHMSHRSRSQGCVRPIGECVLSMWVR